MEEYALEDIDWITIKKKISDVAEYFREEQRRCERMAASADKILAKHKDYWDLMAERHRQQAEIVDALWKKL